MARHTTQYFSVRFRDSALVRGWLAEPREPHKVSRVHVTRAVDVRLSRCPLICHALSFCRPLISRILFGQRKEGARESTPYVLAVCGLAESQVSYVSNQLQRYGDWSRVE